MQCFFVTDLHGHPDRYRKLFNAIIKEVPDVVLFGGDLLPHYLRQVENYEHFVTDFILNELTAVKNKMGARYPEMLLILGNDDARSEEPFFKDGDKMGLIRYMNQRKFDIGETSFYGYSFIPPTPFRMKDWEKYDVSRYADPGCIHPTEGIRTVDPEFDTEYSTIQKDIEAMTEGNNLDNAIFLFHSPPYKTHLDRAALDGQMIDHVPLDVHVGSIAIQRFIEEKQPRITLHGHIHESTRMTGVWKEQIGKTWAINGAHDGIELSLVRFNTDHPEIATRELI